MVRVLTIRLLFAQDEWQFAPTWQLNAGLRYDNHSEAGSKTTASLAVNKKFNENSNAYLSWGQIFKAPNMDDLYYY
jgi:vitamin B12 transporter